MVQTFELDEPTILVGLDTVITGNIDHLADYCFTAKKIGLPRDPNRPYMACNGVTLIPAGQAHVWTRHNGENDMAWMRRQPHDYLDDLFPGHVRSWKGSEVPAHDGSGLPGVRETGLRDCRIVYFHGNAKPHQLTEAWLLEHWR